MKTHLILLLLALMVVPGICQETGQNQFHLLIKLDNGRLYASYYKNLSAIKADATLKLMDLRFYEDNSSLKLLNDGVMIINGHRVHVGNKKFTEKDFGNERRGIEMEIDTTQSDSTIISLVMRSGNNRQLFKKIKIPKYIDQNIDIGADENLPLAYGIREDLRVNSNLRLPHIKDIRGFSLNHFFLHNKIIVLNFWFTGCKPCIKEIPELNTLVSEFSGQEVVFIALSNDPKEAVENFLLKYPFDYHIIPASSEYTMKKLGIQAYPTHVLINREGIVKYIRTGYNEHTVNELRQEILNWLL